MLSENLKFFRKAKGITQEELAAGLNVVRQTISKWEKGLSVPDADMLIRIAEILEVSVSELLGAREKGCEAEDTVTGTAEQLLRINEQLAVRNRRWRRIWKIIAAVAAAVILINILFMAFSYVSFKNIADDSVEIRQTEEKIIDSGD